jgi:hypothetical protein
MTTGTLEEMNWEVLTELACSPDPVPNEYRLCCPLKRGPRGKRFRAEDKLKFCAMKEFQIKVLDFIKICFLRYVTICRKMSRYQKFRI